MPRTELRYRWRYYDEVRKRYLITLYHATEETIRPRHPDAVAVPGTEQILVLSDDPLANSMARFQNDMLGR